MFQNLGVSGWPPRGSARQPLGRGGARAGFSGRRGGALLEVVISLALMGIVGPALIASLSSGFTAGSKVDDRTMALNLARAQLESVKGQAYVEPPVYATVTPPTDYVVTVTGNTLETNVLQRITVTVTINSATVVEIQGYKVNVPS